MVNRKDKTIQDDMCKYKYTFEGNKVEYRIEITNPLALEAAVLKKAPIGFRFRIPKEISADKFWSVVFVVLGVFIIFCR